MNDRPDPGRMPADTQDMAEARASRRAGRRRRFAHRSAAAAITAGVVAVVLLINLAVTYFGYVHLWQTDMTVMRYLNTENSLGGGTDDRTLYTLSTPFVELIRTSGVTALEALGKSEGQHETVKIIFCSERDVLYDSEYGRQVLYTALQLQEEFPDYFDISFVNVTRNPSAVQQYKSTSSTNIYPSNVIFSCGTEYRVYALERFFIQNDSSEVWGYNGEKEFASAILAVTSAESPIACFTTNHGERLEDCNAFRQLVERSGYIVQDIDLSREELPENCRLIITYDPQTDFQAFGNTGETGVSEIDRLDKFLDQSYSFLLFIDDETPELPALEEYLEEWGVVVCRAEDQQSEAGETDNYHIRDEVNHLDEAGYTVIGSYATSGLGASLTKDMRSVAYPAKVVFPHATSVRRSDSYYTQYVSADESSDGEAYAYDAYYRNGVSRTLSDMFVSYPTAVAEVFGSQYEIATEQKLFRLMTLTSEDRTVQEGNYLTSHDRSYVCVVGSTEVASDTLLESASYGNADMLSATLRGLGRELIPVDTITFKTYKVLDMDTEDSGLTTAKARTITILLAAIPPVVCTVAGVAVAVRRKYR